jgi:hypothetical protein
MSSVAAQVETCATPFRMKCCAESQAIFVPTAAIRKRTERRAATCRNALTRFGALCDDRRHTHPLAPASGRQATGARAGFGAYRAGCAQSAIRIVCVDLVGSVGHRLCDQGTCGYNGGGMACPAGRRLLDSFEKKQQPATWTAMVWVLPRLTALVLGAAPCTAARRAASTNT